MEDKIKEFEQMYRANYIKYTKYLFVNYPNIPNHEDVIQECVINFLEKGYLYSHDPQKSNLSTYFLNYVKMQILQEQKKIQRRGDSVIDVKTESGKVVNYIELYAADIEEEQEDNTDEIIKDLDEKFNQIILKNPNMSQHVDMLILYACGYSYEQIAIKHNVTIQKVKNNLHHLRNRLGIKLKFRTSVDHVKKQNIKLRRKNQIEKSLK